MKFVTGLIIGIFVGGVLVEIYHQNEAQAAAASSIDANIEY